MNSKLREEILEESYRDMEGLIGKLTWRFWLTHGGDLEDLRAQANLLFILAIDAYDLSKSKLSTWLSFKIRNGLFDYIKNGRHCEFTNHFDTEFDETHPASDESFSVMELLDEMEEDARVVLQLFLETPKEVLVNILNKNKKENHRQFHIRNRLRNRLRQMGWTIRRVKEAFNELKNVTNY